MTGVQPLERTTATTGRLPALLLAASAVLGLLSFLVPALQRARYPYELTFFEASTADVVARLAEGLPLYAAPSPDFVSWPYPPLYFVLSSVVVDVLGPSLPAARAVSLVAAVVVLLLLGAIAWVATRSLLASIVAPGLYAATFRVAGAAADTARVDSLLLALLLATLLAAMRARTWRGGLLVGALVTAAFLTKQNALLAAAPVLAALLWRRRQAGATALAVACAGTVGSLVVGTVVTEGWYWPVVVQQLLGHGVAAPWIAGYPVLDLALPFAGALAALGILWRAARPLNMRLRWPDDRLVLAAGVAGLVLAGWIGRLHEGGASNVAMPGHAALALAVTCVGAALYRAPGVRDRHRTWAATLVLVQVLALIAFRADVVPDEADRRAGDRFIERLRDVPGGVLVVSHPFYARLAGKASAASSIAVNDLLASRDSRARSALVSQLPWSLAPFNAVVVDNRDDAARLGPELARDFTLVTDDVIGADAFRPMTDEPARPHLLYLRTRAAS